MEITGKTDRKRIVNVADEMKQRQMARQKAADKARKRTDGAQAAAEKNPKNQQGKTPEEMSEFLLL